MLGPKQASALDSPVSNHSNEYTSSGTSPTRRGYRIAEAAMYMGVSPWFVELKIRSKELPALKLCRHYTILREDMDRFLDSQRPQIGGAA
jgi:excisionase family DNA binding protein